MDNKTDNKSEEVIAKAKEAAATTKDKVMVQVGKLKTKEGRDAFVAKAKVVATTAKDKTIAMWKSGIKGKVILCTFSLLILWLIMPSCSNEESDSAVVGTSQSAALKKEMSKIGDFQKIRDSDKLWFNAGEKKASNHDFTYMGVEPNIIKIPDFISEKTLLEELTSLMGQSFSKGKAYPDRDGYQLSVDFVGKGYIVVKTAGSKKYYAYIKTDDGYTTGKSLQEGLYSYYGTKTVPLTNGSSMTIPAFKQLDSGLFKKYLEAWEYNNKAMEAAQNEEARRCNIAYSEYSKRQEAEAKNFSDNFDGNLDAIFKKALATYDADAWKARVHISGALKGKVKVEEDSTWNWSSKGSFEQLKFPEFKAKLEKLGGAKYWADNEHLQTSKENVMQTIDKLFKLRNYYLRINSSGAGGLTCYKVERTWTEEWQVTEINPTRKDETEFSLYDFQDTNKQTMIHFYIIDPVKDADIKSAYVNSDGEDGGTAFRKAFEKKYGK